MIYIFSCFYLHLLYYLETSRDGSRNLFGENQVLQSRVEGEARRRRRSPKEKPRIVGEARVEGAKSLKIESEARTKGEAREKKWEELGVSRWGSVSLSKEYFWKIKWKILILVNIWGENFK